VKVATFNINNINKRLDNLFGLQTSLSGNVGHGGPSLQAGYTWGKSLDDVRRHYRRNRIHRGCDVV